MAFKIFIGLEFERFSLDLSDIDGLYTVAEGFVPPEVSLVPNMAAGTSANVRGGGELVTVKGANREMSFGVHVRGQSEAEIRHGIRRLNQFLRQASFERPVTLVYRSNFSVPYEPLWGSSGANLKFEIIFGKASATMAFPTGAAGRQIMPDCMVDLTIKPYATSKRQVLGFATGGVSEERVGSVTGLQRGVYIPEATTNLFQNPIFSQVGIGGGSWSWDFTAAANIIETQIIDRRFIAFGRWSAKLVATASTLNTYTASLTAANTNNHTVSFYVKREDGSAVTSSDCQAYYNSVAQTTTFESVGGGWYRASATMAGVASAIATGVVIKDNRTIYVDGFQFEEKGWATPLCHGDMVGHAWDGTALDHADPSTRTAARLRINWTDIISDGHGTIRVVLKMPFDNTALAADGLIFRDDTDNFSARWQGSDDTWRFNDGTNSIVSATGQTFSVNDILVFHFVWEPGSLKIYLDGSEIATGSTFDPPEGNTWLHIGSNATPTSHINALFMDFTTWSRPFTAAQASNDFDNLTQALQEDFRISPIPFFWTRAGDGRVENCDDGTKRNFIVAGGIPGSGPAITKFKINPVTIWSGASDIWLSHIMVEEFAWPGGVTGESFETLWSNKGGTVEASACGGEVWLFSGIKDTATASISISQTFHYRFIAGRDAYLMARIRDAGTQLLLRFDFFFGGVGGSYETTDKEVIADSTQRIFILGPLPMLDYEALGLEWNDPRGDYNSQISLSVGRNNATPNDVHLDFLMLVVRPFTLMQIDALDTSLTYELEDGSIVSRNSSGQTEDFNTVIGDKIELHPESYNLLMSMMGRDTETHEVDTENMDYSEVSVVPRWELV